MHLKVRTLGKILYMEVIIEYFTFCAVLICSSFGETLSQVMDLGIKSLVSCLDSGHSFRRKKNDLMNVSEERIRFFSMG